MSFGSEQPGTHRALRVGTASGEEGVASGGATGRGERGGLLGASTLGVDCGGSGTRAVLLVDGKEACRTAHGPMNALLQGDLVECLATIVAMSPAELVGVGLPGVRTAGIATELGEALARRTGVPVHVFSDAESAQRGAFLGGPGIVVLAGTGSAAFGDDGGGRRVHAGGHGFLLGDDGGAYWIGRAALRLVLAAADGTGPPSSLAPEIEEATGRSPESLAALAHRRPGERALLAALAPVVAASTDEQAARILAEAGRRLANLALSLRQQLGDLPVACVGGVFRSAAVRRGFAAHCDSVASLADPAIGAAVAAALAPGEPGAKTR